MPLSNTILFRFSPQPRRLRLRSLLGLSELTMALFKCPRLDPFVGTGSTEIDALATSSSYAGRRPLPWLACNVARATKHTCFHCSKYWGDRGTLGPSFTTPLILHHCTTAGNEERRGCKSVSVYSEYGVV